MQIKNLMTSKVELVDFDTTLQEAAVRMRRLNVNVLPVREGPRLVGIVTARDIMNRAIAEGRNPAYTVVGEVMTMDIFFCYEDETAEEAARIMTERQVRLLPVANRERTLVGIISINDLTRTSPMVH